MSKNPSLGPKVNPQDRWLASLPNPKREYLSVSNSKDNNNMKRGYHSLSYVLQ